MKENLLKSQKWTDFLHTKWGYLHTTWGYLHTIWGYLHTTWGSPFFKCLGKGDLKTQNKRINYINIINLYIESPSPTLLAMGLTLLKEKKKKSLH